MTDSPARVGNCVCIECARSFFIAFDVSDESVPCPECKHPNPLPAAQRSYPPGLCNNCGDPLDGSLVGSPPSGQRHLWHKDGNMEWRLMHCAGKKV